MSDFDDGGMGGGYGAQAPSGGGMDWGGMANNAWGNIQSGANTAWGGLKSAGQGAMNWFAPQNGVGRDGMPNGGRGGVAPYLSDPTTWFGAMGTGLGIYSHMQNAAEQGKMNKQLAQAAGQPINVGPLDPSKYYNPMTEAARAAYMRQVQAEAVSQGKPLDGAYGTNLASEALANAETSRWKDAGTLAQNEQQMNLQAAMNNKNSQLMALSGRQGPNFQLGDMGAFGSAIALMQRQKAQDEARQYQQRRDQTSDDRWNQQMEWMRRMYPAAGPQPGTQQGNYPSQANNGPWSMGSADESRGMNPYGAGAGQGSGQWEGIDFS